MDLQRVGILAPCESMADFPTFYTGSDASGLLANWTTAWRPALLAATKQLPEIVSAYDQPDPEPWGDGLLLVTSAAQSSDAIEWIAAVRANQAPAAGVIEGLDTRPEIIAAIDEHLPDLAKVDADVEGEFFALAYAYLQTELLTRELHYSSVFDPELFQTATIEAAEASVANDSAALDAALRRCYDQLEQARTHSYPVDIHLLDIVLTAETTLGESLAAELAAGDGKSVLLSGSLADKLAEASPTTAAALRTALAERRACVIGGGYDGQDMSTLSAESMHDELQRGRQAIEKQLGVAPTVFAQHSSGIAPRLPQLLCELGFTGALLVGFDGNDPLAIDHGRSSWIGMDGSAVNIVVGAPRDASQVETLLRLGEFLTETLQRDHTATVILAGWPGARHEAMTDLRTVAKRSNVLGTFVTLEDYFSESSDADHQSHVEDDSLGPAQNKVHQQGANATPVEAEQQRLLTGLAQLATHLTGDAAASAAASDSTGSPIESIAKALGAESMSKCDQATEGPTRLLVNPWSYGHTLPTDNGGEVPALGFFVTQATSAEAALPRAENLTLRNERMELIINGESGGLQAIRTHATRQNRLSQRLVLYRPGSVRELSEMQSDEVEIVTHNDSTAAMRSRGQLVSRSGESLARFEQTFHLDAHSHCLLLAIKLDPVVSLGASEAHQLACRFALGDDTGQLYRGLQWARLPVARGAFTAGEYVEMDNATGRLTIASESPLVYRRAGGPMLDALLPAESLRSEANSPREMTPFEYRLAIALDHNYPLHAALGGLAGLPEVEVSSTSNTPASGWWLHTGAANVVVSRIEMNEDDPFPLRLRLMETEGRRGKTMLQFCRPMKAVRGVSFLGQPDEEFTILDGVAEIVLPPYGWRQIEVAW